MKINTVTTVTVVTTFDAIHRWPEAPKHLEYLKHSHRHVFSVDVTFTVNQDDRQIEFFEAKDTLDAMIKNLWHKRDIGSLSCEMMAKKTLHHLAKEKWPIHQVSVYEDNGCYATVTVTN